MSFNRVNCHVFVDFDGTIVPSDATDMILEAFAADGWKDIEREWQAGHIGSRECMTRQIALIRATPEQMLEKISQIDVDPGFATFVQECERNGIGMTVVSDGMDYVIERVLRNAGHPQVKFFANRLEHVGGDRWKLSFPHARSECQVLAGNCKCSFTEPHGKSLRVVVGDGRSDFCVSARADLVFAKGTLLALCEKDGLPHTPYDDFHTVTRQLLAWLRSGQGQSAGDVMAAQWLPSAR